MNKIIFILIFLFTFTGCLYPVCKHNALYYAHIASEKYETRIAVGPTYGINNVWHCQAQAKIDGEWEFLKGYIFGIMKARKDKNYKITEYMTIQMFVDTWVINNNKNIWKEDKINEKPPCF